MLAQLQNRLNSRFLSCKDCYHNHYHGTCIFYQSKSGAEQANEIKQAFTFTSIHCSEPENMNRGAFTRYILHTHTETEKHTHKQTCTDCKRGIGRPGFCSEGFEELSGESRCGRKRRRRKLKGIHIHASVYI